MIVVSIPFVHLSPLFIWALIITLLILIFLYPLSINYGFVDHPFGRKKHKNAVPLIGGISIFIGASAILIKAIPYNQTYMIFWLCCFVLVLLSVADDIFRLKPKHRLVMQFILACLIIVFGETSISNLGNLLGWGDVLLGQASLWFTAISMVGITNAVNMMDGLDGLTGCVSLVELSCLLFLSIHYGVQTEAMVIAIVMGAVVAFLIFNFPTKFSEKRKVFLGDAGSTLMGLTLSWLCVRLSQDSSNHYPPVLMLWIMALPVMDTLHLIINRKIRGVSPFKADRRHIHHILLQLDYSPRQVVLILMSLSFMVGAGGIYLWMSGAPEWLLFAGMVILFSVYSAMAYLFKKRVSLRKYKFLILSSLRSQQD
jgi:UDP-GlcNAc:undecaprenyl-phosphate/decaprenyl-phosphate GlcNAc-1-phosphate transferase